MTLKKPKMHCDNTPNEQAVKLFVNIILLAQNIYDPYLLSYKRLRQGGYVADDCWSISVGS